MIAIVAIVVRDKFVDIKSSKLNILGVLDAVVSFQSIRSRCQLDPAEYLEPEILTADYPAFVECFRHGLLADDGTPTALGLGVHSYWKHPWRFCITNILGWR